VRILLPTHAKAPGGLATAVRGLARALPGALGPEDELRVVAARGAGGRAGRALHEQFVLARAARRVDLVHLPDHRPLLASRTPFVLTVYDVLYLDRPEWFPRAVAGYKRAMLAAAVRKRPALVVCGSEHTRERLLAHHPGLRVRVIPPGVDMAPRGSGSGDYFVTVAVIETRKNHLGLLRGFEAARRRGLRLRWKVAGPAGYGAREIVPELRGADGVDVLGAVSDDERDRLLRDARFLAFPSLGEGFGIPPLEAMARGVPVVCSTAPAVGEAVGDAALRVDPDDVDGWADALLRLEEDRALGERLAEAGLAQAARFDWARAAAAYVAAYREALS
jgi:glycosyltransferase involved in cell wall biosynthesis